ncbi:MAG: hypothetical protein ACPG4X_14685 [Pikeienuella sp.]
MVDTVNVQEVFSGSYRRAVHLTNESDGTGESAVAKVDISTLTHDDIEATYSTIDLIEYSVSGGSVVLEWNHTTPDEIAILAGQGLIDWRDVGGKTDPQSAGGTGDIQVTTVGFASGSLYDITIHYRPKS